MTFPKEEARTPLAVGDMWFELHSPDPAGSAPAEATYRVQIRMSDGEIKVAMGDLSPQLTQTQINSLLAFMATMRQKAVVEFLP